IHGATISADAVAAVTTTLLAMTHNERAALPVMHTGRIDVIGGGALILRTVLETTGASEVVASEHDILDGIALRLAASVVGRADRRPEPRDRPSGRDPSRDADRIREDFPTHNAASLGHVVSGDGVDSD